MNSVLQTICIVLSFFLFDAYAQNINWTHVYHEDFGRPLYTGGTSYSTPTFADIDGDGDDDLFQGCMDGTIWFFENIGTPDSASWHFITDQYNDIQFDYLKYSNVTFADIEGDGDLDMFVGGKMLYSAKGLHFYENTGTIGNPSWQFISDRYMNIDYHNNSGMSYYCHAQFLDFDNDNDLDLFFINSGMWITQYENIGTNISAAFSLITENLLNCGYANGYGYLLEITDMDRDNDFDIFLGSAFYRNTGTPDSASWQLETYNYINLENSLGMELNDIDNDNDYDMFVGMNDGKIYHYENTTTTNEPVWQFKSDNPITLDVGYYSSPSFCDIDGDNLPEMFIANGIHSSAPEPRTSISYYENSGTEHHPSWQLITPSYANIRYQELSAPVFADMDGDGDYDMFLAYYYPHILYFENTGDKYTAHFDSVGTNAISFDAQGNAYFHLALVDIDADGDLDMFVSSQDALAGYNPILQFFRNDGNASNPVWTHVYSENYPFGVVEFMDEDNDGDFDMFISSWGDNFWGRINLFRNTGNIHNPNFQFVTNYYENISVGSRYPGSEYLFYTICFYDTDQDGDQDLIIGERDGGINLFRNDGLSGIDDELENIKTRTFLLMQNYPNPFNAQTQILFYLSKSDVVDLSICDIIGQRVKTLTRGKLEIGYHQVRWDGTDSNGESVASGIYCCRLRCDNYIQQLRLILLK